MCKNNYVLKKKKATFGKDVEKLERSYIIGGNVKWCSHFGSSLSVSQNVKHQITTSSSFTPRNLFKRKTYVHTITYTWMFMATLFIITIKLGAWVAQSVKCLTSAQVMISWFVRSSHASGSVLMAWSLGPASDSVFPSLSLPLPCSRSVSLCLSIINKC